MRKLARLTFLLLAFSPWIVVAQTPVVPSDNGGGSRPVPDPTVLTTEQIRREITSLRELIAARLDGFDKTITLLQKGLDERAGQIDFRVGHLQELQDEKFKSIEIQFKERDTRTDQSSRDSKVAVDAALQAAKEAVAEQNKSSAQAIAKSEIATTKQIDQIIALLTLTTSNFNDKIDDLKNRLTGIDGHSKGVGDSWGYVVGAVGMLIAGATFVILLTRRRAESDR